MLVAVVPNINNTEETDRKSPFMAQTSGKWAGINSTGLKQSIIGI